MPNIWNARPVTQDAADCWRQRHAPNAGMRIANVSTRHGMVVCRWLTSAQFTECLHTDGYRQHQAPTVG